MKVLGLNAFTHDASAALIVDGRIVAFAEEERFDRVKHSGAFPVNAVNYCLAEAGLSLSDIDHAAFAWDPFCGLMTRFFRTFYNLAGSGFRMKGQAGKWFEITGVEKRLRGMGFHGKFHFVNHYLAHAASAFYPSPFEDAAILIIDGVGELATASYFVSENGVIRKIKDIEYPHSLGLFYAAITEYLGWEHNSGEGKVMGLAPYGKPDKAGFMSDMIGYAGNGEFRIEKKYFDFGARWFTPATERSLGPHRKKGEPLDSRHESVAASVQLKLEEIVLAMINWFYEISGHKNLCFAGGVALNSVLNGRIINESPFENHYFQPAAYDAGTSLGAAMQIASQPGKHFKAEMEHVYLGPEYGDEEISAFLRSAGVDFEYAGDDTAAVAAKDVADGMVVGWFQGRMEIGPRALGNRSIIADPRRAEMKDIVNKRVKGREPFRPFAPSVLVEDMGEYFDMPFPSPYMLIVCPVKEDKKDVIPAVTHVDGTARLQTVDGKTNPAYHRLIAEFKKITGVPVVMNTSFNLAGWPIVNTPAEALEVYRKSEMDVLVLGNCILRKPRK